MSRKVFRYVVPVDDNRWNFDLSGPIVHVATRTKDKVEFWAESDDAAPLALRTFIVVGTGHPIEPDWTHVGTVLAEPFVWHLYEVIA